MFNNFGCLFYVWAKSIIISLEEYTESLAFQATLQHPLNFKHLTLYIEGDNKKIIDAFNLHIYEGINSKVMDIIRLLQAILHHFLIISIRWILIITMS